MFLYYFKWNGEVLRSYFFLKIKTFYKAAAAQISKKQKVTSLFGLINIISTLVWCSICSSAFPVKNDK